MKYSGPIAAILERETARIESRHFPGATRLIGEMGRLMNVVQALEAVALNRDPLGSSFKCNTQRPQGIGCCDGQTKQAPQQRGTWRDFGGA
jgi:hypothetical protein